MNNFVDKYWKAHTNEKVRQESSAALRPDKKGKQKKPVYGLSASLIRNGFIKDRDRILYSKSFRRLEHKAQIFSHEKGDHYRTRLTHTIEVAQIARSIARNLGLNEDLTEAIALGHDVGHTPFGHQGERTLGKIMSGEETLNGKIKYPLNYGGFKHNFHSIRVLDKIERIYDGADEGLFLTWQTVDGILKHTKIKRGKEFICDMRQFTNHYDFYFTDGAVDLLDYMHPVTLEGQIVALADEIAQRQHDLDDSLEDRNLGISLTDIVNSVRATINSELKHVGPGPVFDMAKTFSERLELLCKRENSKQKRRSFVSEIIEYFVIDATYESIESLLALQEGDRFVFRGNDRCFVERIIDQSRIGKAINEYLESFINSKIINSYDVNRFDGRAVYVIKQLFKAYYQNPRQMSDQVIKTMNVQLSRLYKHYKINDTKIDNIFNSNLRTGKRDEVEHLIKVLQADVSLTDGEHENDYKDFLEHFYKVCGAENSKETYGKLKKYNEGKFNIRSFENEERIFRLVVDANRCFLTSICNYIAGMTDNYAIDEFQRLYAIRSS